MSYRITIICDRKLPTGELCGSRRTTATGPGITLGESTVRAAEDAAREGWTRLREGGWACLGTHGEGR